MWLAVLPLLLLPDVTRPSRPVDPRSEELFVRAYLAYLELDYAESTALYRRVIRRCGRRPISAIAAYNISCNFARQDENDTALEWLKKAVRLGYCNIVHIDADGDLTEVRRTEVSTATSSSGASRPWCPRGTSSSGSFVRASRSVGWE